MQQAGLQSTRAMAYERVQRIGGSMRGSSTHYREYESSTHSREYERVQRIGGSMRVQRTGGRMRVQRIGGSMRQFNALDGV